MKKVILFTAVFALSALLAAPAMARLKDSRHNLGETGDYNYRASNISQICVFCHTPHNPVQNVPLWNRNAPTQTLAANFKAYTASVTVSQKDRVGLAADSISLFCLSCHDGGNGLWALVKNQGTTDAGKTNTRVLNATRTNIGGGTGNLTNDHPVNIRISGARSGDADNWQSDATITSNQLRLFRSTGARTSGSDLASDYVECASCHDPHRTEYGKFLRKSNASSSLCLTCHNK